MIKTMGGLLKLAFPLFFCVTSFALAQQTTVIVHGIPLTCQASNGQQVPFFFDPNAAAAARVMGGARADYSPRYGFTIAIDPQYIAQLPRLGALFVVFHECAHVALPMGVGLLSPMQERNADCHAIRSMRQMGFINSWNDFQQAMSALFVSGGGHGVDPARVNAMVRC
jgi:hypothetical protein